MKTIIFASAFRANVSEVENAHNSIIASQKLAGLLDVPAQTCVGSWKEAGQDKATTELTFVAPVNEDKLQDVLDLFLKDYEQDAVMFVNPVDNQAFLAERDGSIYEIGKLQEISESEAYATECYTYWQGKYWLAK